MQSQLLKQQKLSDRHLMYCSAYALLTDSGTSWLLRHTTAAGEQDDDNAASLNFGHHDASVLLPSLR